MARNRSHVLLLIITAVFFAAPTAAFGAGNIRESSGLFGYNARHGDIGTLVASLPLSFLSSAVFGPINVKRVYLGNWLRDYSQVIDVNSLKKVPEPLLRAVVSILGFVQFGYATGEFDITAERLGVYRPEEHIDNPKGYDSGAQQVDKRLRGPVLPIGKVLTKFTTLTSNDNSPELEIDKASGMKNYIANENIGITTSAAYIRRELNNAIAKGRQSKGDDEIKYDAMRHLGGALHCLEDLAAHSNYVELCLRLIGQREPESGLSDVFAYVGDAATVSTAAGLVPPLVTGSFGPLDLYESLLGELDDQVASGSLNELDVRMSTNGGSLAPNVDQIKVLLQKAELVGLKVPPTIYNQLQGLRLSTSGTDINAIKWDDLKDTPNSMWKDIEPFFKLRDDIAKAIDPQTLFGKVLGSLSASLDKLLYGALGSILGPVIGSFRKQIMEERTILLQKEETTSKDPGSDIFAPGSTATNPTHSQVSKDHFDCILNIPAAKVAAATTNFATRAVVSCWDEPSLDADHVITNVLQVLHHPFNADQSSEIQNSMFEAVELWWKFKNPFQKTKLLALLHKDTIATNKNRLLITNPFDYMNIRGFGNGPTSKPLIPTVKTNLANARAAGTISMTDQAFEAAMKEIDAPPTIEQPNPFDAFLALIPGDLSMGMLFQGVGPQDVMGAPTMGNIAKDSIVGSMMQAG